MPKAPNILLFMVDELDDAAPKSTLFPGLIENAA
jgi:hypothetical protein